jgi:virulence-associated protein VagC
MKIAKIFQNDRNQAVQLPIDSKWHSLFRSHSKFSKDFMSTREQPLQQNRINFDSDSAP